MEKIMYVSSLVISLFVLIMTIITMYYETIARIFGTTETWFCLCISVVLICIGLISDKR